MKFLKIYSAILLLTLTLSGFGQNAQDAYLNADLPERTFDKSEWKELTKDLNYSEELPEPKKVKKEKKKEFNSNTGISSGASAFLKIIAVVLAIILVVIVLLHLLGAEGLFAPRNKKIKRASLDIDLEDIEENLGETELEGFIRRAIETGDFSSAIRLYYLGILKELSLKKLIKHKKDKTNGEYARELRGSVFHKGFRELTNIFERIWYGKTEFFKDDFYALEPKFKDLINRISEHKHLNT